MPINGSKSGQIYSRARAAIPAKPAKPAAATWVAAAPAEEEELGPPAVEEPPVEPPLPDPPVEVALGSPDLEPDYEGVSTILILKIPRRESTYGRR